MAVNGLGQYNYVNRYDTHRKARGERVDEKVEPAKVETEEQTEEAAAVAQESAVTATDGTTPKKAESYKPDMEKVRQMKADMNNNVDTFKKMISSMIEKQGNHANNALKTLLNISEISQEDAAKAVADDGEWGVDATATRILDFAKAISGGDPSKIATLKDAVQKGFAAAGKVWGGDLPEISQKTLAKVMEGFDEWEKSGNAATTQAQAGGVTE